MIAEPSLQSLDSSITVSQSQTCNSTMETISSSPHHRPQPATTSRLHLTQPSQSPQFLHHPCNIHHHNISQFTTASPHLCRVPISRPPQYPRPCLHSQNLMAFPSSKSHQFLTQFRPTASPHRDPLTHAQTAPRRCCSATSEPVLLPVLISIRRRRHQRSSSHRRSS
jgi:hypothetical protein